jgi:hypothetical protein
MTRPAVHHLDGDPTRVLSCGAMMSTFISIRHSNFSAVGDQQLRHGGMFCHCV